MGSVRSPTDIVAIRQVSLLCTGPYLSRTRRLIEGQQLLVDPPREPSGCHGGIRKRAIRVLGNEANTGCQVFLASEKAITGEIILTLFLLDLGKRVDPFGIGLAGNCASQATIFHVRVGVYECGRNDKRLGNAGVGANRNNYAPLHNQFQPNLKDSAPDYPEWTDDQSGVSQAVWYGENGIDFTCRSPKRML